MAQADAHREGQRAELGNETGIWGGPEMIEDKADAVMFTIRLMRRLAGQYTTYSRERDSLTRAARILESLLEEK